VTYLIKNQRNKRSVTTPMGYLQRRLWRVGRSTLWWITSKNNWKMCTLNLKCWWRNIVMVSYSSIWPTARYGAELWKIL
jgi:hypothetical protein